MNYTLVREGINMNSESLSRLPTSHATYIEHLPSSIPVMSQKCKEIEIEYK
jgi:hypothetical protein